jgi:hypothetical protein
MGVTSCLLEVSSVEKFVAYERAMACGDEPKTNPILGSVELDKAEREILAVLEELAPDLASELEEGEELPLGEHEDDELLEASLADAPVEAFPAAIVERAAKALPTPKMMEAAGLSEYGLHYYDGYRKAFKRAAKAGHPLVRAWSM